MRLFLTFLISLLFTSIHAQQVTPNLYNEQISIDDMVLWADSVYDNMTVEQRVGQLFMPIVDAQMNNANRERVRKYIAENKIGGLLFSKGTVEGQAEITNFAQRQSPTPLFISVDAEWGLSMRLDNTISFPKNMTLGAVLNDNLINDYGKEMGRQCREMGVHISFAPVLDMNTNPKNPVIGTRSYGEERNLVAQKAIQYAVGLESEGIIAVGKHFPGHGDTSTDSHKTLPVLDHDSTRMYDYEIAPFREYINSGHAGMLTAHISVPALDEKKDSPSSISKKIVTDILQKELGFSGLVFTDGLAMKGISGIKDHCVKAILAGNDILLGPIKVDEQYQSVLQAVNDGTISEWMLKEKVKKILQYKYLCGLSKGASQIQIEGLADRLNWRPARVLNRRLYASSITLIKDSANFLPLKNLQYRRITTVSVGSGNPNDEFHSTLSRYLPVKNIAVPAIPSKRRLSGAEYNDALKQRNDMILAAHDSLGNPNLLIIGVYSRMDSDIKIVNELTNKGIDYILVFFQSPYRMDSYKEAINNAKAVLIAYEDAPLAREYAAQAIFGGIPTQGVLSVTVPEMFEAGMGIFRPKTRLGYAMPEQENMRYDSLKVIDQIIGQGLAEEAFPGCQILIARNGNVVFQKSYGYFDFAATHKVEDSDLYDLASVTKIAATVPAMMKLRDDFQIQTQYKISQYVPELKNTDKESLTIRDALFHETGLQDSYPFFQACINKEKLNVPLYSKKRDLNYRLQFEQNIYVNQNYEFFPEMVSSTPSDTFSLQVADNFYVNRAFQDTVMNKIISLPLKNRGKYKYSCLNFVLLRHLIENVTKKSLDSYLDATLFAPLGATTLTYNPRKKIDYLRIAPTENDRCFRKQILIGYVHDEIAAYEGGVEGNAGLFGCASDLAKLMQVMLNGGVYGGEKIFSKETVTVYTRTKSQKSRRGMGFDKPDMDDASKSPCAPEADASVIGHTGYTGTACWIDTKNNLTYIFLTNRVYPNRWNRKLTKENYRTRIQTMIYNSME